MSKVIFPQFEIYSNPTVSIFDLLTRKIHIQIVNVIENSKDIDKEIKNCIKSIIKYPNHIEPLKYVINKQYPQYNDFLDKCLILI